jgi:hypothetical protein
MTTSQGTLAQAGTVTFKEDSGSANAIGAAFARRQGFAVQAASGEFRSRWRQVPGASVM